MSAFRRLWPLFAILCLPALAAETARAVVLARVLAYDRNLPVRSGKSCDIGILYRPDLQADAQTLNSQFASLSHVSLQGLPLKSYLIPWENSESLARTLDANGVDALVMGAGLEDIAPEVKTVATSLRVLTIAEQVTYTTTTGIVVVPGSRPSIFVNLPITEAQGASLGADFLQLVTVIR